MNRILGITAFLTATLAFGQDYATPVYTPAQLDNLVSRIALYPDPLLAQVLAAATYPDQIRDAASWADANRGLTGDNLAAAIADADLPFDPSIQALLPFPSVLDMLASDMNWTAELGDAVLAQRADVMDAIQRMRQRAWQYGYLRSNDQMQVIDGEDGFEILPAYPDVIYVPVYDPVIVYAPPRGGYYYGAIRYPYFCRIGPVFLSWGWGGSFRWHSHFLFVQRSPWHRDWTNRQSYVHAYGNWDGGHWRRPAVDHGVRFNNVIVNEPRVERRMPADRGNSPWQRFDADRRRGDNAPAPAPTFAPPAYNSRPAFTPRNEGTPRPTFDRPQPQRPAAPPVVMERHDPPPQQRSQNMERREPPPQQRQFNPAPRGSSENNGARGDGDRGGRRR